MAVKPKNPPTPQPDPEDDDDDAGEFTPKQLEVMNNTISAAVTAHVKRGLKPIQDQLAPLLTIPEQLTQITERLGGGNVQPGAPDPKVPPTAQPANDPEKIAMRKRLDAIEAEREKERATARQASRDAELNRLAAGAGVDKNRMRGAVALLREQVKFDADGNPLMTVKRHGIDEDVALDEGAAEFFKTDEGKAYLAPTQSGPRGGAGSRAGTSAAGVARGGGAGAGGNNAAVKGGGAAKQERQQKAAEEFVGAVGELFGGGNITVGGS